MWALDVDLKFSTCQVRAKRMILNSSILIILDFSYFAFGPQKTGVVRGLFMIEVHISVHGV